MDDDFNRGRRQAKTVALLPSEKDINQFFCISDDEKDNRSKKPIAQRRLSNSLNIGLMENRSFPSDDDDADEQPNPHTHTPGVPKEIDMKKLNNSGMVIIAEEEKVEVFMGKKSVLVSKVSEDSSEKKEPDEEN